jgi:hypothetical protein
MFTDISSILTETFPLPQEDSSITIEDIPYDDSFPIPKEFNESHQSMQIIEAPYNILNKNYFITNQSLTNTATTAFTTRLSDKCAIQVYEVVNGNMILINEEDF